MNKRLELFKSENGQSIVIIAIVMVGMLALAGVAIDGGNLFLQRRNTQNAADAASLAGTRVLSRAICYHEDATDAAIAATVDQYALANDVPDLSGLVAEYTDIEENVLGTVGAGSIPVGASGVSVDIQNNVQTFFVGVLGIEDMNVSATALAMTGPLDTMGGLRPMGIPLPVVQAMDPGDAFSLCFGNCNLGECIIEYTGGLAQHRGWLNLGYVWNQGEADDFPRAVDTSGSANFLKDWMENGWQGVLYSDCEWNDGCAWGDYIHAKPGKTASAIEKAPIGETITIPIFDYVPHYDEIPDPKPPKAHQGGGYYYHIVGFMAFQITAANQGSGCIDGVFEEAITGYGQVSTDLGHGYGEGGACETHLQAVNLWR